MYGKTAVLLSGGGGFGKYHNGIFKALLETGMFPKIISGTSIGSVVAAQICNYKFEDVHNLFNFIDFSADMVKLKPNCSASIKTLFSNLMKGEAILCSETIEANMKKLFGNTTFKDTFE